MRLENWLYTIPLRLRSLLVRSRQDEELDELGSSALEILAESLGSL